MENINKLTHNGTLRIDNSLDERLPVVTNGLVAHYPFDEKGGSIDLISGAYTHQNVCECTNILDALAKSWRDPNSWQNTNSNITWDVVEDALRVESGRDMILDILIPIDTAKHYYIEATLKQASNSTGILYMGTIAYDTNGSFLAGHPGTYDYFGACGFSGLNTNWQTVNNNYIGGEFGSGRTGEDSNTGNFAAFHPGTKYIRIMLLTNYPNGTGPLWIKDLKFYAKDPDTSNTISTSQGISIQESATNLVVNQPTPVFNAWAGFTGTSTTFLSPTNTQGIKLDAYTSGGVQWGGSYTIYVQPNTVYTVSRKIKASNLGSVSVNFFYIRQYNSGGSQLTEYGVFDSAKTFYYDGEYVIAYNSFTTESTTAFIHIESYEYTGGQTIMAFDLQLEQKPYPSQFKIGSKSTGFLSIPNPVQNGNYTISFKCQIPVKVGFTKSYQTIMSMGSYYTNNSWAIMDNGANTVSGNQTLIRKGNNGEWDWASGGFTNSGNFNNENVYTLVRDASNYKVFLNGVYKGYIPHYSSTMQDRIYIGSRDNNSDNMVSCKIRDLSIFNRVLSDHEIKMLAYEYDQETIKHKKVPKLSENNFRLNGHYYHFPLSDDINDSTKTVSGIGINLAYDDEAIWVGSQTTNLFNTDIQPWTVNGQNFYKGLTGPYNTPRWLFKKDGISNQWNGWESNYSGLFNGTVGRKFTISFLSRKDTLGMGWGTSFYTPDWSNVVSTDTGGTFSTTNEFKKSSGTVTFTENVSNAIIADGPSWSYNTNAGTCEVAGIMWEMDKIFPSPYCAGTRGVGSLTFNLNSSIGLDWNGNWSICYWKKPVGTYDDTMTAYNIESIGCNGNSVGGGYIWWGKNSGSDSINSSSPTNFIPSDYFNKWQFISLIKSGSTITIKTTFNNSLIYVRTIGISSIPSDYYITQYGYDLKLGGWDNSNPTNTYFKDLIVAKYALSDTEVQSIYRASKLSKEIFSVKKLIEN